MPLLSTIGAAAARAFGFLKSLVGGYEIDNSLRFNSGSTDYLNRSFSSGNRKTFTYSGWCKRPPDEETCFLASGTLTTRSFIFITSSKLAVFNEISSSVTTDLLSNAVFRDPSAWYHIVVAVDTTQATEANRVKIYVNGEQTTSFGTSNYPSLNEDFSFNNNITHEIGRTPWNSSNLYDGYFSEINWIDGQALDPTDFGEFDSDTNIWKPIPYTGTYGTNGFYLEFQDSSALGDDTSGNSNDWTVNGLTSIDQTTDTCTNNFNTLNPLIPLGSNFSAPTEGNLSLSSSGTGDSGFFASTIIPSAGKWYFEVKTTVVSSSDRTKISIANFESVTGTDNIENGNYKGISVSTGTFGRIAVTDGASTTEFDVAGYVPVANDIMIFAVDMDNSRVYIGKNGTWFTTAADSGGNPATATGFFSPVLGNGFAVGSGHSAGTSASATNLYNFGNPPFTISSGNADANGFGNFEYAVPSGYYAICTKNLANFG